MKLNKFWVAIILFISFFIIIIGIGGLFLLLKDNKNNKDEIRMDSVKLIKLRNGEDKNTTECYYYYNKDDNFIYFAIYNSMGHGWKRSKVEDAHIKTFRIIKDRVFVAVAVDKNNVYYFGEKIENSDPKTLRVPKDNKNYMKDKNNVYSESGKLKGADSKTFETFKNNNNYAKDKNNVYFLYYGSYVKIKGADSATFEIPDEYLIGFAKDKNNIYYEDKKLEGANPKTFCIDSAKLNIFDGYIIDNQTVYVDFKLLKVADAKSFIKFRETYFEDKNYTYTLFKDKNYIYYKNRIFSDTKSFKILDENYSKDKNYVYFEHEKIIGADPLTFEVIYNENYAKDKNYVYYKHEKIIGADPVTFKTIYHSYIHNYTKDKNYVYYIYKDEYKHEKIIGADPATFEIINYSYSKDKNYVYYRHEKVIGADLVTFESIYHVDYIKNYARDKFFVYYAGKKVIGADPATFKTMNEYAKDKNFVYKIDSGEVSIVSGADPKVFFQPSFYR